MKIKELNIYGYGKWIDQTFSISSNYHVLFGQNEAGKSTLLSFIQSILFGFPTRHSSALRYEPKESSRYGGKIIIEDDRFGEVAIERVHGKATGDVRVILEDGTIGSDDMLEQLLFGINRELYQSIFSFRLKDLENVESLNKEQLYRSLLSAGSLGSEEFLKQVDKFNKQASILYKPTGRVPKINKKIKVIEEKQRILQRAKEKNVEYLEMGQQINFFEKQLKEIEEQKVQLEEMLNRIHQIEKDWHITEEIRSLKKSIKEMHIPELPEEGMFELNRLNQDIEQTRREIHQEQEKLREYQKEHQPSREFLLYQEYRKEIEVMRQRLPVIQEEIREKQYLVKEKIRMEQTLIKEKMQEDLLLSDDAPKEWTKEEKNSIISLNKEYSTLSLKMKNTDELLTSLSYKQSSYEETLDQLENDLWSNEDFREMEEKYSSETTSQGHIEKKGNWWAILIGLFSFVAAFFVGKIFGILLGITGIILLMIGVFSYRKKEETDQNNTTYSYEAFIQQKEIKKQWRKLLASIDILEEEKRQALEEKRKNEQKIKDIVQKWEQLKNELQLPKKLALTEVLEKEETYFAIRKQEQEYFNIEEKIEKIDKRLDQLAEIFDVLEEISPPSQNIEETVLFFTRFLQQVNQEEEYKKQYVEESRDVQQAIGHLVSQEKSFLQHKQQLIQSVGAESEDVFRHLYEKLKDIKQKEERVQNLKSQQTYSEQQNGMQSISDVKNRKEELQHKLQINSNREKEITKEKISLELEMRKIEEGGEYTALLQEFENEKSELQELVDEWASNKLAAYAIEKTLSASMEDRFPKTIQKAEEYFSILTYSRYKKIEVTNDSIKVLHENGRYYYAEELSRGTAEPLYVALRLAFIWQCQDIVRLPIIIDDGFVNFDNSRKQRMQELLLEVSKQTQVLFFSFEEELLQSIGKDQVTMLQ